MCGFDFSSLGVAWSYVLADIHAIEEHGSFVAHCRARSGERRTCGATFGVSSTDQIGALKHLRDHLPAKRTTKVLCPVLDCQPVVKKQKRKREDVPFTKSALRDHLRGKHSMSLEEANVAVAQAFT